MNIKLSELTIKILKSAKENLKKGYRFYELQQKNVGKYFLDSLFSGIESLRLYAGVHSFHCSKYHRFLSKHFPFAVYYRI